VDPAREGWSSLPADAAAGGRIGEGAFVSRRAGRHDDPRLGRRLEDGLREGRECQDRDRGRSAGKSHPVDLPAGRDRQAIPGEFSGVF
jgi:hypothetical protein